MRPQDHIRVSQLATEKAAKHSPAWADAAVIGLRLAGWLAVTSLAAAGIVALATFALGSFSLQQTMLQLSNLATRYVAADGGRQGQFDRIVCWAFWGPFVLIGFFRRASLVRAFDTGVMGDQL